MANEWYKDYNAIQRRAPAGSGGAAWAGYLRQKSAVEKGYSEAFKELDIAAQQEGVTAERPVLSSGMSQAQHQEVLQEYLKNINNEVLRKNVTAALKDIQNQGMQSRVNVALPSLANLTQENAQAVINSYVNTVNQKVYYNYATTAVNDLHSQGVANGVNVAVPVISNNLTQAQAQDIVNKYQSQVNSALLTKSTQDAINGVAAQAKQYGVSVPTPSLNNLTEANSGKIVDDYVKQVNNAILVKNTQNTLKDVQSQAASYGVKVATPAVPSNISESAANTLIDKYVADVNSKLSSVAAKETQTQAVNDSQVKTSPKVNSALVGPTTAATTTTTAPSFSPTQTVTEKGITKTYTIQNGKLYNVGSKGQMYALSEYELMHDIKNLKYDSKGNIVYYEVGIPENWTRDTYEKAQQSQQAAAVAQVKAGTYVAPEIKGSGLAYKTLLSNADQKELIRERESNPGLTELQFRLDRGLSVVTVAGKYAEPEFKGGNKSAGQVTVKKVGSGDVKIANIKANSTINSNASAKTNTAQTVTATKLTQKEVTAKEIAAHPGQVQLKDGTWIDQVQGSRGVKESVKIISAVKSLEEADKLYQQKLAGNYNPVSRKDITVEDIKAVVHGTVTNQVMKDKHDQAILDAKEFKKQLEAFNDTIAGLNVKSIQTQGHRGVGEGNVFVGVTAKDASGKALKTETGQVQYTARSKTGKDYAKIQAAEERAAKQLEKAKLAGLAPVFAVTSGKEASKFIGSDLQDFKTVDQINQAKIDAKIAKALEEAHKINPQGSEEYFAGVAESTRRNSIGTKAVITEDLAAWNALISKATKPAVNKLYDAIETRDKLLKNTSISLNEKGQVSITKAGKETLDNSVTYNANKVHKDIINDSVLIQGFNRFAEAELNEIANKPVTYAGKLGIMYAAGAGLGAAAGGAKVLTKMGGAKIAESVGVPILKKAIKATSAVAVDAALVGSLGLGVLAEDAAFKANTAGLSGQSLKDAKVNRAASYFAAGKEFAVGGLGFAKGARYGPAVAKGTIKVVTYARDGTPQVMNAAKSDMIRFLRDERATTGYGKKAVEQWDKISKAKSEAKPAFELVEDANGNLVLREITTEKVAKVQDTVKINKFDQGVKKGRDVINKRSEELSTSKTVSTNSGKMILKTEAKTISKIENDVLEVVDLSTVTKHPQELKIAKFKAKQRVEIAKDRMKKHEFKLNEKPKIEIKSQFAGRKNIEPKRKMTVAQQNAAKRKAIEALKVKTKVKTKRQVKVTRAEEEAIIKQTKVIKHKIKTESLMRADAAILGLSKLREKQQQELIAYGKVVNLPITKFKPVQMQAVKPSQSQIAKPTQAQKPSIIQTAKPAQSQTTKSTPVLSAKPVQDQIAKDAAIMAAVVTPPRLNPTPGYNNDPRKPKPNVKGGEGVKPNYKKRPPNNDIPKILPPFKFRSGEDDDRRYTDRRKFERDIRNTLGSLKSMFG